MSNHYYYLVCPRQWIGHSCVVYGLLLFTTIFQPLGRTHRALHRLERLDLLRQGGRRGGRRGQALAQVGQGGVHVQARVADGGCQCCFGLGLEHVWAADAANLGKGWGG